MSNRRTFLQRAFGIGAGVLAGPALAAPQRSGSPSQDGPASESAALIKAGHRAGDVHGGNVPVVTTDVPDLPYVMEGETKVFRLVAEVVKRQILPGKTLDLWGFNGSCPGPTIQVTQGDRVKVILENRLPEPTSMHWHGFEDDIRFDGMPGISQKPVPPGGSYTYEFTIHQAGTFFYHSHMAMQEMAGMLGGFIMHPAKTYAPSVDHDFLLHLQEYAVLPSNTIPDTMNMEFNWLVLNGKSGPAPTPLLVKLGSRVRIRFVNLGMDHHPMHLHGHTFYITGTEGGRIPESAWWPGNTVLVGVAQAREIEFVANNPGDWMLHCHLPHHMMNQMSSNVGRMSRMSTRGGGMPAGVDMNNGMGMLNGEPVVPMGDDYGTSLGRGMGVGSTADMTNLNGPMSAHAAMDGMQMGDKKLQVDPHANAVPNYPQDAFMEGPMMNMDAMVDKPENFGLPAGWSEYMQGMMTFVRVLPADKYDEVMRKVAAANSPPVDAPAKVPSSMHHIHPMSK